MPLNLPPQNSLFFEREVICQCSIVERWPHRSDPVQRWHIQQDVRALRSMRGAKDAYEQGLVVSIHSAIRAVRHRTNGRSRRHAHG